MQVTELGMTVFLQPTTSVLFAVSMIALQPPRESYFGLPLSTVMLAKLLQATNALLPMLMTDLGIVTLARLLQALNALVLM